MSQNVMARKEGGWLVISVPPDVCKTPVGSSTPPIPYPVTAKLEQSVAVVPNVRANGHPVVVYDQTHVPKTLGDAPGQAKGIKSGTVEANCWPKTHSPGVRAGKRWVIRHDDEFWMNGP